MMTVKQVSSLTGISIRTLQFYDEIDLFKPAELTDAGYRLYDESSLEKLQQILFFKELDFSLKEIKAIMENPQFDRDAALKQQRRLIRLKRDRLNALLGQLDQLIKGETCMEFKNFDMTEYFRILNEFKETHTDEIIKQLGNMENYDEMITDLKSQENEIAEKAVRQYTSLEKFTEAVKHNFHRFLTDNSPAASTDVNGMIEKTEELTRTLTSDLTLDPASAEVQKAVCELVSFTEECSRGIEMGDNYWSSMADLYLSNPVYIEVNDRKYGAGASEFIGLALKACSRDK